MVGLPLGVLGRCPVTMQPKWYRTSRSTGRLTPALEGTNSSNSQLEALGSHISASIGTGSHGFETDLVGSGYYLAYTNAARCAKSRNSLRFDELRQGGFSIAAADRLHMFD